MDDAEQFKKDREEQYGGSIRFLSYATLIGRASEREYKNRGGILYLINDTLHFEDFERSTGLMILFNQKEKYTKTEFSIDLGKVSIVKEIKEKNAKYCVQGILDENEILPAPSGLFSLLSKSVLQIMLNGEASLFLDLLDKEGFMSVVNEFMLKSEPL